MDDLGALIDDLRRRHAGHTILLYGSHARGDATPDSDVDVASYTDATPAPRRDARRWRDTYVDGFVYPTATLTAPADVDALRLRGARILVDERGLARPYLAALEALHARGPAPLSADDAQMRRAWAHKTLARIARGDAEAHYRHHQLVFELFPDLYALRGVWFPGPKPALAELARTEPALHAIVTAAFAPGASLAALTAYVHAIAGATPPT